MHPILRRDMRQPMFDAEKFQKDLQMLVNAHAAWAGECQQNALVPLMEHAWARRTWPRTGEVP